MTETFHCYISFSHDSDQWWGFSSLFMAYLTRLPVYQSIQR